MLSNDCIRLLVYLACVAVLITLLVKWLKKWFRDYDRFATLINQIPGPFIVPVVGNVLGFILRPQNQYMNEMSDFVKIHHPMFRLWVGPFKCTTHITSWKCAETIFNSSRHIEKYDFYKFLAPWIGEGLLTSTGEKWHLRRKLITPAFHATVLEGFLGVVSEQSQHMIRRLKRKMNEGKVFDIAPFVWEFSLDVICETAMGTKMNIQSESGKKDAEYIRAVSEAGASFIRRCATPWLHPDFIFKLSPSGWKFYRSVKIMHNLTNKVIRMRKAEYLKSLAVVNKNGHDEEVNDKRMTKKRKAFLDILIEAAYSEGLENKAIISDKGIREEVDTFMFEGHDTTASAISWAIYLLGRHPEIQEELVQEIKNVFGDDSTVTMEKLSQMKLLDRCIKESLRLYPSVPFMGRKLNEDCKIGDYIIPAETGVFILIYFLHRDPEVFPNPEVFNPDNFLPEACEKRKPFAYTPFSAGSRNCIGQKFAMLEIKTILCAVLRNFRIESKDDAKDIKLLVDMILRSENGINVHLYPRT